MTNEEILTEIKALTNQFQTLASEMLKSVGALSAFVYQLEKKITVKEQDKGKVEVIE